VQYDNIKIDHGTRNSKVSLNETHEFPFWGLYICVDINQGIKT